MGFPQKQGFNSLSDVRRHLQGGPWTAVHHSQHGARFPGVPEEMTSATYIPLPSGCPLPWPSWLSGDMTSPSAHSVNMPAFKSLIYSEMRTKIITTSFAQTLVLQRTQFLVLFLESPQDTHRKGITAVHITLMFNGYCYTLHQSRLTRKNSLVA